MLRDLWPYYSNKNGQQNESKGHESGWCAEQHIPPHSINLLNQYIHEQADNTEDQCQPRTFLRSFQVVLLMSCVRLNIVMSTLSCVLFKRMQEKQI